MCVQKIHRLLMAALLIAAFFLLQSGFLFYAELLIGAMAFMLILWGLFDFCPALFFLSFVAKQCETKTTVRPEH